MIGLANKYEKSSIITFRRLAGSALLKSKRYLGDVKCLCVVLPFAVFNKPCQTARLCSIVIILPSNYLQYQAIKAYLKLFQKLTANYKPPYICNLKEILQPKMFQNL